MRQIFVRGLVGVVALFAFPAVALAAQSTANMNVSITVTAACSVSVTDVNFGSVSAATLSSALTSTAAMGGLLTYTCSSNNAPSLTAGQGQNYSSGNRMIGASLNKFLPYNINLPTLTAFDGTAQTAQITATIPAQGTLPAVDNYSDAVVLALTY